MNLREMATVSNATVAMAFYGSGAAPGGATGFRRCRSRCESARLTQVSGIERRKKFVGTAEAGQATLECGFDSRFSSMGCHKVTRV